MKLEKVIIGKRVAGASFDEYKLEIEFSDGTRLTVDVDGSFGARLSVEVDVKKLTVHPDRMEKDE